MYKLKIRPSIHTQANEVYTMQSDDLKDLILEAAKIIARAKLVLSFTGAGISAESGIPTFRDSGGLWEKYRVEDVATPEAFMRNPKFVWEFYLERKKKIKEANPNPAHYALADLERILRESGKSFYIITQNIDNLHREAGNKNIIELHGNIWYTKCSNSFCEKSRPFYDPRTSPEEYEDFPPRCSSCGSLLRPHVVWFGEPLPEDAINESFRLASLADVVIVVGTSGAVFPAAYVPYIAREHGGKVIEVNIRTSSLTSISDVFLMGRAGEILPRIVEEVKRALK